MILSLSCLPHRQLPLESLLHGLRHRLLVRLVAVAGVGIGRCPLGRCAACGARTTHGGQRRTGAGDVSPRPPRDRPPYLRLESDGRRRRQCRRRPPGGAAAGRRTASSVTTPPSRPPPLRTHCPAPPGLRYADSTKPATVRVHPARSRSHRSRSQRARPWVRPAPSPSDAATFNDPKTGDPAVVVQPSAGTFVAFDAVCPHEGCTVAYGRRAKLFICPCHGSRFNGETGARSGARHQRPDPDHHRRGTRTATSTPSECGPIRSRFSPALVPDGSGRRRPRRAPAHLVACGRTPRRGRMPRRQDETVPPLKDETDNDGGASCSFSAVASVKAS